MDSNISVSFVCQRCLQPLSLDQSITNMSEHKIAELSCECHFYFYLFNFISVEF